MGIFSTVRELCPKCKKMTTFDGPYSDCGCYSPPGKPGQKDVELDDSTTNESKRIVNVIRDSLSKTIK